MATATELPHSRSCSPPLLKRLPSPIKLWPGEGAAGAAISIGPRWRGATASTVPDVGAVLAARSSKSSALLEHTALPSSIFSTTGGYLKALNQPLAGPVAGVPTTMSPQPPPHATSRLQHDRAAALLVLERRVAHLTIELARSNERALRSERALMEAGRVQAASTRRLEV